MLSPQTRERLKNPLKRGQSRLGHDVVHFRRPGDSLVHGLESFVNAAESFAKCDTVREGQLERSRGGGADTFAIR